MRNLASLGIAHSIGFEKYDGIKRRLNSLKRRKAEKQKTEFSLIIWNLKKQRNGNTV